MRAGTIAVPQRSVARTWAALPRLLRFFVVGGVNTVFGYGAYALLLFVGFHYGWAALLGTIAGVLFNFFTTGRLVFGSGASRARLVRFVSVYAVVYVINVALLALLQRYGFGPWSVGPYAAGMILIVPIALVSYVLMRRFVFGGARAAD